MTSLPTSPSEHAGHAGAPLAVGKQYRVLLVCSHVVQYASPIFRQMAQDPRFDVVVAYCSMQGAEAGIDPGFGVAVSWDQPQLEGYAWVHPPNRAARPGVDRFGGLFNPGLWKLIARGRFDAVWLNGYFYASAWIAIFSAKWHAIPVIFSTEAYSLRSLNNYAAFSKWKLAIKKRVVQRIFSLGDILLGVSSGAVQHLHDLGFSKNRIILAPYTVDNAWWNSQAARVDRNAIRDSWQIPPSANVLLFCAKLQPWKCPRDVLEAFVRAAVPNSYLVFAGDGPLRASLEERVRELGAADRVRMLGFVNQSQLPSVYRASDLLVLPSLYDGFGLVVNEAMLCGCPAAVSDRVGARFDLVRDSETGWIFPCGNIDALALILRQAFADPQKLARMSEAARRRMESWSPREYLNAFADAVSAAASRPSGKRALPARRSKFWERE